MNDERFVVMEAWCTGADEHSSKDSLIDALDLRDRLRQERPRGSTGPVFFVVDRDDPERGWLDHEDLYEEEYA